jgi:hypothetical protein
MFQTISITLLPQWGLANGIIVGTAANPDYNTALALYNSISPASKPGGAVLGTADLGGQISSGIYTSAEYNQYHKWGFNITVVPNVLD